MSDKQSSLYAQAKKNQPELEFERHEAVVSGIMSTREFSALELSEQMSKVGYGVHSLSLVSSFTACAATLCGLPAFMSRRSSCCACLDAV